MSGRTDIGSRFIAATAEAIYSALLDPEAIVAWRPPSGMHAEVLAFDPRPGGRFSMAFLYDDPLLRGKTGDNADLFEGTFLELAPCARIVERIVFTSEDPAFSGAMIVTTQLTSVPGGAEVTITCSNVPSGISAEDHATGLASTLANLAAFVKGDRETS